MYKENYMASIVNIFADQGSDYTLTLTVKVELSRGVEINADGL